MKSRQIGGLAVLLIVFLGGLGDLLLFRLSPPKSDLHYTKPGEKLVEEFWAHHKKPERPSPALPPTKPTAQKELRAMWISYLDLAPIAKGKSEAEFEKSFDIMCKNIADLGLNTLFIHVRSHADSYYPSTVAPWSAYVSTARGKSPGYDPLAAMMRVSKNYHLTVYAWVNPYRGPAEGTLVTGETLDKEKESLILAKGYYYLNPAKGSATKLVQAQINEICTNYDVAGVVFDDYFYPPSDAPFDAKEFDAYTLAGGTLDLTGFRQEQVDNLVHTCYKTVHHYAKKQFGISPQGNPRNCLLAQFANFERWLSTPGYVDFLMPQTYWGYHYSPGNAYPNFDFTLRMWKDYTRLDSVKLMGAIGTYRLSIYGYDDWITGNNHNDFSARMVADMRTYGYAGFSIFNYNSLFAPVKNEALIAEEMVHFKKALDS